MDARFRVLYKDVEELQHGYIKCRQSKDDYWAVYKGNKRVGESVYKDIQVMEEDRLVVLADGLKQYLIDDKGSVLINGKGSPIYKAGPYYILNNTYRFNAGTCKNEGIIFDRNGKIIRKEKCTRIVAYNDAILLEARPSTFRLLDYNLNIIADRCQLLRVIAECTTIDGGTETLYGDLIKIYTKEGCKLARGMKDGKVDYLIDEYYDDMKVEYLRYICFKKGEKLGLYDSLTGAKTPAIYDDISKASHGGKVKAIIVRIGNKYGLLNQELQTVLDVTYNKIEQDYSEYGLVMVFKDGKYKRLTKDFTFENPLNIYNQILEIPNIPGYLYAQTPAGMWCIIHKYSAKPYSYKYRKTIEELRDEVRDLRVMTTFRTKRI